MSHFGTIFFIKMEEQIVVKSFGLIIRKENYQRSKVRTKKKTCHSSPPRMFNYEHMRDRETRLILFQTEDEINNRLIKQFKKQFSIKKQTCVIL